MSAIERASEGQVMADTVEKLISPSRRVTAQKIDLVERPPLNATRSGDGLPPRKNFVA